ncbi:MAG: hypothetical protein Ct9H300mP20_16380 [Gammaproteobacteria bacterium]|nr:MAG: hypothetical protein Ct9H300mP20_16380 [Gammaproteobacteria bacterium]
MINLEVKLQGKGFIKDISELIKTGNNLFQISEQWPKENDSMLLKLEWMSDLLMDCIRHKFLTETKKLSRTPQYFSYLSKKGRAINFFSSRKD